MRNVALVLYPALLIGAVATGCGTPTDKFMAERPKIEASAALLVTRELTDYPLVSTERMGRSYLLGDLKAAFVHVRTIGNRAEIKPGELLVVARVALRRDELPHYIEHTSTVSLTVLDADGVEIASVEGDGVGRSGTISPSSFLILYPLALVLKLFTDPAARSSSQSEAIEWAIYDSIRKLHAKREALERAAAEAEAPATVKAPRRRPGAPPGAGAGASA